MTDGRASQIVAEVSAEGTPNARATQVVGEVLAEGTPIARATQIVAEVDASGTPNARASQIVGEALAEGTAFARVSQIVFEILLPNRVVEMPPIYPENLPGLEYSVMWSPGFYNMPTAENSTGAAVDLSLADEPLHDFELSYSVLSDQVGKTDFKRLMGFWGRMGGQVGRFLFHNPDDDTTFRSVVGTTDGTNTVYGPIKRTFGIDDDSWTEAIGYLDLAKPFAVYLDDVEQNAATYDLLTTLPVNQQIKFHSTPSAGKVITISCSYFYYCKFNEDIHTFEKFVNLLWLTKQIKIHSCRAGT